MWKRTYRKRDVKAIINELLFMQKAGFERVSIKDDSFTLDRKFTHQILNAITKQNQKGNLLLK